MGEKNLISFFVGLLDFFEKMKSMFLDSRFFLGLCLLTSLLVSWFGRLLGLSGSSLGAVDGLMFLMALFTASCSHSGGF